jgi:hypothetical protein
MKKNYTFWKPIYVACLSLLWTSHQESSFADDSQIIESFRKISRATNWHKIQEIRFHFQTFHPQGMIFVKEKIFLTSVQTIDRNEQKGLGHLFQVDWKGHLTRQIRLEQGKAYHPGGLDFDGTYLWVPVAEYRPDSRSVVFRIDPETLHAKKVFEFNDHLGTLVCNRNSGDLIGANWGSRTFYRWKKNPESGDYKLTQTKTNGAHYIDYQDGRYLTGTGYILFNGLAGHRSILGNAPPYTIGGLELVNSETLQAEHQIAVPMQAPSGRTMTQNPFEVKIVNGKTRFYFLPDDGDSVMFGFETR